MWIHTCVHVHMHMHTHTNKQQQKTPLKALYYKLS